MVCPAFLCLADLNGLRSTYLQEVLEKEKSELKAMCSEVHRSRKKQEKMIEGKCAESHEDRHFGERLADRLTEFTGSWGFLMTFIGIFVIWVVVNTAVLIAKPFNPYPFIFLNLVLLCLAAIEAPIIMMSQNRQNVRDRLRAEYDYRSSLRSEQKICQLHEKVDQLLMTQWQGLFDIERAQMEWQDLMISRMAQLAEGISSK